MRHPVNSKTLTILFGVCATFPLVAWLSGVRNPGTLLFAGATPFALVTGHLVFAWLKEARCPSVAQFEGAAPTDPEFWERMASKGRDSWFQLNGRKIQLTELLSAEEMGAYYKAQEQNKFPTNRLPLFVVEGLGVVCLAGHGNQEGKIVLLLTQTSGYAETVLADSPEAFYELLNQPQE